jgi:histone acetyltransferase
MNDETIRTEVIFNDDSNEETLLRLIEAKNVFAKQLPKMPKDYIVRLVFDRRHRTFIMLRDNDELIAGCCFRPFPERKFAEIVFLAVNAKDQVKGYGTQLMNQLKEYCKTIDINYFLTYADNFATGYFRKQGFTEHISMPKDQWNGFIKDYDGGTLMGCPIYECINYLDLNTSIEHQRDHLLLDPILGESRDRWERVKYHESPLTTRPPLLLHEQLHKLLDRAIKLTGSWPFREPVQGVPGYTNVVKEPIDLKTMIEKNQKLLYRTKAELQNDLDLMVQNSVIFNGENHEISKLGREVLDFLAPKLLAIVEYNVDYSLIKA